MSEPIVWTEWNGVPITEAVRDDWAEKIATGEGTVSTVSGDSAVIGEVDTEFGEAPSILITDYAIRRWKRVPLAPDSWLAKWDPARRAAPALADALEATLKALRALRGLAFTGSRIPTERYPEKAQADAADEQARAALRAAGRLP